MQCEYRSAREGDVPALRELWKEAFGDGDRFLDQFFEGPFAPERSRVAVVEGVTQLTGAPVQACDLRAGAALVIAGLAAQGETELTQVQYIERGYEDLVGKLRRCGAVIEKITEHNG